MTGRAESAASWRPVSDPDATLAGMSLTAQQIEARRTGISGSDAVAIAIPEESYKKPIEVFLSKHGRGQQDRGESERARWGQILEPVVVDDFLDGHPYEATEVTTLRHRDRDWQIGTPDRALWLPDEVEATGPAEAVAAFEDAEILLVPERVPDALLEVKTHGAWAAKKYDQEVPDYIRVQVDWYMSLTGAQEAWIAILADTHLRLDFHVERDAQLESYLLELCEDFWRRYVLAGVEPPPDGSEAFSRYVSQRYREHSAELVTATPADLEAWAKLRQVRAEQKRIEKRRAELEQDIQLRIAGAAGLASPETGKPIVTWKRDRRGRVKTKDLVEELVLRAGVTDKERAELEDRFRSEPGRRFLLK